MWKSYVHSSGLSATIVNLWRSLQGLCNRCTYCWGPRRGERATQTKPAPWEWGRRQEQFFKELKEKLTSPPVLQYTDFNRPFLFHTDASRSGLGDTLYQRDKEGRERVIAYASRSVFELDIHLSLYEILRNRKKNTHYRIWPLSSSCLWLYIQIVNCCLFYLSSPFFLYACLTVRVHSPSLALWLVCICLYLQMYYPLEEVHMDAKCLGNKVKL